MRPKANAQTQRTGAQAASQTFDATRKIKNEIKKNKKTRQPVETIKNKKINSGATRQPGETIKNKKQRAAQRGSPARQKKIKIKSSGATRQ
jgi:hypothetical protein